MPANVEIKARLRDVAGLEAAARRLSGQAAPTVIIQSDTFFLAPNGRLKLRELKGEPAQLIYYKRSDTTGPKLCDYHISSVTNPAELKETLSLALGVRGEVRKERKLYLVGQTRVHVDDVAGLGDYMELEVVLRPEQTVEEGQKVADQLMEELGVTSGDLVQGAYLDLLLAGGSQTTNGTNDGIKTHNGTA